jgi:hypothetical protein
MKSVQFVWPVDFITSSRNRLFPWDVLPAPVVAGCVLLDWLGEQVIPLPERHKQRLSIQVTGDDNRQRLRLMSWQPEPAQDIGVLVSVVVAGGPLYRYLLLPRYLRHAWLLPQGSIAPQDPVNRRYRFRGTERVLQTRLRSRPGSCRVSAGRALSPEAVTPDPKIRQLAAGSRRAGGRRADQGRETSGDPVRSGKGVSEFLSTLHGRADLAAGVCPVS